MSCREAHYNSCRFPWQEYPKDKESNTSAHAILVRLGLPLNIFIRNFRSCVKGHKRPGDSAVRVSHISLWVLLLWGV
jgi:hypothetical protein